MKRMTSINFSQTDKLHLPSLQKHNSEIGSIKNKTTNNSGVINLNEIERKQQELNLLKTKYQLVSKSNLKLKKKMDDNHRMMNKLEKKQHDEEIELRKEEENLEKLERVKLELISKLQKETDELFEEEDKLNKLTHEISQFKCFKEEKGDVLCQLIKEFRKIRYLVPQKNTQVLGKENVFNSNKTHKKSQFYNLNHSSKVSHFNGNRYINKFC